MKKEELKKILAMAPIIQNYNGQRDWKGVERLFNNNTLQITSDPFIISAKK